MLTRWPKRSIQAHPTAWYYTLLTCAVVLVFLGTNAWMLVSGRELVWTRDALPLYTNFIVWSKHAFGSTVAAAFDGQGFALPQFTYSMGYGADVPLTMGSYLQDPINLIMYALPDEWIGFSYGLSTFVRVLLCSYTFSWYCFSRGHGRRATGIAALAYATCGFVIMLSALRHAKFIDWAVLLPLLLLGADRLFQKKSPVLFVGALFLQFCVSIYFSYMSCITLLVYCLVKYFFVPRKRSTRDFLALVGTFLLYGVLAFLLSGLLSLPQIVGLLSQGRATSGGAAVPLVFTVKYYAKVAAHFIGAAGSTEGMAIGGVSTIGLISFIACGKRFDPRYRKPWLIGFAICFAGVLIPFLGHVMNGMGYSTDRWMLVLAFVCSYILCMALPHFAAMDRADWKRIGIGVGIVGALTVVYAAAQLFTADGIRGVVWPLVMAALFAITFFGIWRLSQSSKPLRAYWFAGVAIIVCVSCTALFYCSPLGESWGNSFPKAGSTWKSLSKNSPGAAAERIDDDTLWRYTVPRVYDNMKNSPLVHDVMGIDYYTSYYNQHVDNFRRELGIGDHHMNFSFVGSDSRLAIEAFTGAKYYIAKDYDSWRVPYGFAKTDLTFKKFQVYRNENPVPLAFTAPAVIKKSSYDDLSMIEKQETLLQGAAVSESDLSQAVSFTEPNPSSQVVDYEIVATDGMELDATSARVYKKDATATLRFRGIDKSEACVSIEGLGFKEYSPSALSQIEGNAPSIKTTLSDLLWTKNTTYPITATIGKRSNTIDPATPEHLRYGGKVNWVFNLGYFEKAPTELTLHFSERGEYSFSSLQVACQPVEPIVKDARALAGRALDDLKLNVNGMSATATLEGEQPEIAVFTFAYSPGWSVKVDGEPARALKVNSAFLGVELSGTGTHSIVWTYTAPGVREGSMLTIAGVIVCLALLIARRIGASRRWKKGEKPPVKA